MGVTKHFCGKCGKKFANEPAYLKHICKATGFSPREPKHFDAAYRLIPGKELPKGKIVYLSEKKILEAVKKTRREG
jgi:uncharacterized C2H2 Zn-finger protein